MQSNTHDTKREMSSDSDAVDDRLGCQRRKSKCDGQRPTCAACRSRNTSCSYEVADGVSRRDDLKQKVEQLSVRVAEFEQIFNMLRSQDDIQASNTLARLRLGERISDIVCNGTPDGVAFSEPSSAISGSKRQKPQRDPKHRQTSPHQFFNPTDASISPRAVGPSSNPPSCSASWPVASPTSVQDQDSQATYFRPPWGRRSSHNNVNGKQGGKNDTKHISSTTVRNGNGHTYDRQSLHRDAQSSEDRDLLPELRSRERGSNDRGQTRTMLSNQRKPAAMIVVSPTVMPNPARGNGYPVHYHDQQQENAYVPIWALRSLHVPGHSATNRILTSFVEEKKAMLNSGMPAESFLGTQPIIELFSNENALAHADDLSKWAFQMARSGRSLAERVVMFWSSWYLMRWLILPGPETYDAIPEWLRPTPNQILIPHSICIDFIACPQIREAVVQRQDLQIDSDWLTEFTRTASCNWPTSVDYALERDLSTGGLTLNTSMIDHVKNMDNWTVGPLFRALMPKVDLYIRIKYDNE